MQAALECVGLATIVAASFAAALALGWLSLRCLVWLAAPPHRPSPAGVGRSETTPCPVRPGRSAHRKGESRCSF